MTHVRIAAAVLAVLAVLPVAQVLIELAGLTPPLDDEPNLTKTALNPWYWIYILAVWSLSILLIIKASLFSKNAKIVWIVLVILFSPVTTWALLYRYYWYKPSQVPKNLEDQRRILRENVAKIKAGEKVP
jgi:uncharacterized membrane protein YozB (DUF420 family)